MMDLLRGLKNTYFLGVAAANLEPPLALLRSLINQSRRRICLFSRARGASHTIMVLISSLRLLLLIAVNKSRYNSLCSRTYLNSIWEKIKTSHVQIFSFFSIMERIRKGSDLPKKKWGSPSIQQKYSHTKLTQSSSALYFVEFSTRCTRLKMT